MKQRIYWKNDYITSNRCCPATPLAWLPKRKQFYDLIKDGKIVSEQLLNRLTPK